MFCLIAAVAIALVLPSAPSHNAPPLISKVEHFFVLSADAEKLFRFFKEDIGLPVVWPFRRYGDFSSGGVSLGNVVMELELRDDQPYSGPAAFKGIAFEPVGDAEDVVMQLDHRDVPHASPSPYKYVRNGEERVGWVNVYLNIPPEGVKLFFCDYKDREQVANGRRKAAAALNDGGGGPLGIIRLKELELGVRSYPEALAEWHKLIAGSASDTGATFLFGNGPALHVVRAKEDSIKRVVISVRSAKAARLYLASKGLLGGSSGATFWVTPAAVSGLRIEFIEEN